MNSTPSPIENEKIAKEIAGRNYLHPEAVETLTHWIKAALDQKDLTYAEKVDRLEAALKLIAFLELQDKYTSQQIALHALRIEPLKP